MTKSIKLLITDIGGVLVKTDEAIIECIEQVFEKNGIPKGSREKLLSAFGVSLYDYILNYLPDEHRDKADFLYKEFKEIYPLHAREKMIVFSGVNATLSALKNNEVKVSVLSCMIKSEVDTNLSLLDFKEFNLVFSLEDYEFKRPDPTGLQIIMKKLGATPEETAYIGDTVNDIKMAKNAGVTSIAVRSGAQDNSLLEAEKPDYLIDSFANLLDLDVFQS